MNDSLVHLHRPRVWSTPAPMADPKALLGPSAVTG